MPFHTTVGMVRDEDLVLHLMAGPHHAVRDFVEDPGESGRRSTATVVEFVAAPRPALIGIP